MKRLFWIAAAFPCGACLLAMVPVAFAQARPGPIVYYEPIDVELADGSKVTGASGDTPTASARLSAFGRQFVAQIAQSRALTRRLPPEARTAVSDIVIWEGTLEGIQDSWIRLVQRGAYTSGTFSDGNAIYRIAPFDYLQGRLVAPDPLDAGRLVVFQDSATLGLLQDLVVSATPVTTPAAFVDNQVSLASTQKPVLSAGLEVEVAGAADAEFAASYGDNAQAQMISAMTEADALFVQQMGLHLVISELRVFDSEPDPFDATSPQAMLEEFAEFVNSTPAFLSADLAHLFTDRSLGMNGQITTIGIANPGGVCQAGQGVAINATGIGLITAHEIAHNFGVPHDGEAGSFCEDETSGFLMDPTLTGSSSNQSTFSSCSVSVFENTIPSLSCLSPIPDSDLVLSVTDAPPDVFGNSVFGVSTTSAPSTLWLSKSQSTRPQPRSSK